MTRYFIDPFTSLIQDTGSGEHASAELRTILSKLLDEGKSLEDLIKLIMESFGMTRSDAERLVNQILELNKEDPDDDYENDLSPF